MKRVLLYAFAAMAALLPAVSARAQMICNDCAHLCALAHQIESAVKLRALYADIDVAFEADTVAELVQGINLSMLAWNSKKDAESPCYKELLAEFSANPDMPAPPSVEVETSGGPSGNLLRTSPFNCAVEDPKSAKDQVCPEVLQALQDHESVHQRICEAVHAKAKAKGYAPDKLKPYITRTYSDTFFHSSQEVTAYDAQIETLKQKMSKVLDSGCNVRKKSIKDFIAQPGRKPNIPDLFEALRLINQQNSRQGPKPKLIGGSK